MHPKRSSFQNLAPPICEKMVYEIHFPNLLIVLSVWWNHSPKADQHFFQNLGKTKKSFHTCIRKIKDLAFFWGSQSFASPYCALKVQLSVLLKTLWNVKLAGGRSSAKWEHLLTLITVGCFIRFFVWWAAQQNNLTLLWMLYISIQLWGKIWLSTH